MKSPSFFYFIFRQFAYTLAHSVFKIKVINRQDLVDDGPCIIVANHQSFLDPPMIGQLYETDVHFLARHSLWKPGFMNFALPHCQCIPINQTRPDPASIMKLIRVVKAGGRVIIFPEGSRCPDGEIHEAMPGIGLILSKLTDVPIQAIRIEGAYDCLPIHSSKLRIRPITISIGKPFTLDIPATGPDRRAAQRAIGQKIMQAIKDLPVDY